MVEPAKVPSPVPSPEVVEMNLRTTARILIAVGVEYDDERFLLE